MGSRALLSPAMSFASSLGSIASSDGAGDGADSSQVQQQQQEEEEVALGAVAGEVHDAPSAAMAGERAAPAAAAARDAKAAAPAAAVQDAPLSSSNSSYGSAGSGAAALEVTGAGTVAAAAAGGVITPSSPQLMSDADLLGPMEPLASPMLGDETDWLSSAKPRRLSYNAAASTCGSGADSSGGRVPGPGGTAAASVLLGNAVEETPAATIPALGGRVPGRGGGGAGGVDQSSLTLNALRERFSRATGAGGGLK